MREDMVSASTWIPVSSIVGAIRRLARSICLKGLPQIAEQTYFDTRNEGMKRGREDLIALEWHYNLLEAALRIKGGLEEL